MNPPLARHRAPAKLNLGLEIIGRRPDGYHELVTIFQTIALYDEITVAAAPEGELTLSADPALGGTENLILRAARSLAAQSGSTAGATLTLDKGIPVAAGLGGGSSDAATTLRALHTHWQLATSADDLAALATRLGADVPFFLRGGTALATGIGEELTALPPLSPSWFVTLTPMLALPADKTRRLYAALTPRDFGDGTRTLAQAARLRDGLPLDSALLTNSFAAPLERLFPALTDWHNRLLRAGAPFVLPSGSGPTLYTMVESAEAAQAIQEAIGACEAEVHVARCISGETDEQAQ